MDGHHARHSWDHDESLSESIIEAIAAASERQPAEVERTLYTEIDPVELNHRFDALRTTTHWNGEDRIVVRCDGYRVTVLANGEITVRNSETDGKYDEIADDEGFQVELVRLIREAEANGVDVEGGWACQDGSDPEWGIEIYEVG